MRSSWKTLVAALTSLLVLPQLAMADEVQDQIQAMQQRLQQLEDRLQATTDELGDANARVSEQQELIERSGIAEDRSSLSALSQFLDSTEFSGLAAASWNWNFAKPDTANGLAGGRPSSRVGENSGAGTAISSPNPFHRAHNNIQIDQLLFSMHKPSTAESRAGFGADIYFGIAADNQQGTTGFSGDTAYMHQAYVTYLADIMGGMEIKAGRFDTILGAESFRQDDNWNVTRGLVWSIQPVNHTGVLVSGEMDGGLFWSTGMTNSVGNTTVDTDNQKAWLGQVGMGSDTSSIALNWLLAPGGADSTGPAGSFPSNLGQTNDGILSYVDLVMTWQPSENLSTWLNFDWISSTDDGVAEEWNIYAVALAGRLAISEDTGFTTRLEYIRGTEICSRSAVNGINTCGNATPGSAAAGTDDLQQWSVTATLDHALTDNLTARAEYRYDGASADNSDTNDFFATSNGDFGSDNQHLFIGELLYSF